ncbi:alpha/beta hydrolase family protein [Citricoccus nitrophenolicus]|uniref:Alpha/beta hydrolase family protein n=1 Tax=Citricoccus muralis TaxID=169134 RepID=A0A3D9LC69_9MICC|nr:alpha/beta hydrolase [Citricoccus muralis]REE03989.1 alpha/beta hydrolase family protein [Citricoccus muralis]
MSLPALGSYPDAEASWTTLSEMAGDLKVESKNLEEAMDEARASWRGLESGYQHPDTQEQVWTALDDLVPHAGDWASALSSAKDAIDDFVETGKPLQTERESLDQARPGLSSRRSSALTSDDETLVEGVRTDILAFNERATTLTTEWETAQETLSTALAAISVGTTEGLPLVTGHRDTDTGVQDWAKLTSGLDEKFGEIDPDVIWKDLKGLDEEELRDWLEANPEAARALAEHRWADNPPAGTPESIMDAAMADDAELTKDGIQGIQDAWLSLTDAERERMALLYPGVIGVLNGVPLATRGRTNQITVAGLREQTAEKIHDLGDEPTLQDFLDDADLNSRSEAQGAYNDWRAALKEWKEDKERLGTVQEGLDQAWFAYGRDQFPPTGSRNAPGYTTLYVSTDGRGQIATMRGTPGPDTERTVTFVPGTKTTIASVDGYNQKLDTIDGKPDPTGTVSIYWAGTDFPQSLVWDNRDSTFNERGAPLLAAFDHAADLEIPESARTTAIGHSAGGSMLGTAERGTEGLTSDNIVYVAPAGQGHEVGSPEDTANPDAHRYWIQTNYDLIEAAQNAGGGGHGPNWWSGSDIAGDMGATRLESGYLADGSVMGKDDGFAGGHSSYFDADSTSADNLESIIRGGDSEVVLYHEGEDIPGPRAGTTNPIVDRQPELSGGDQWDDDQVSTIRDLEQ